MRHLCLSALLLLVLPFPAPAFGDEESEAARAKARDARLLAAFATLYEATRWEDRPALVRSQRDLLGRVRRHDAAEDVLIAVVNGHAHALDAAGRIQTIVGELVLDRIARRTKRVDYVGLLEAARARLATSLDAAAHADPEKDAARLAEAIVGADAEARGALLQSAHAVRKHLLDWMRKTHLQLGAVRAQIVDRRFAYGDFEKHMRAMSDAAKQALVGNAVIDAFGTRWAKAAPRLARVGTAMGAQP